MQEILYISNLDNILAEGSGVETSKASKDREHRKFGNCRTHRLVFMAWDRQGSARVAA